MKRRRRMDYSSLYLCAQREGICHLEMKIQEFFLRIERRTKNQRGWETSVAEKSKGIHRTPGGEGKWAKGNAG